MILNRWGMQQESLGISEGQNALKYGQTGHYVSNGVDCNGNQRPAAKSGGGKDEKS